MARSTVPTSQAEWDGVVARLDHDPDERLNTFHEACGRWADDRGRLALILRHDDGSSERWTYYDLARATARASAMLAALGLVRGDRVASVLGRQVEAWIVALAAWRSGLVYVPLFSGFGAASLATRLEAARTSAVVVDHRWRGILEEAREHVDWDVATITVTGSRGTGILPGDWSFWAEIERPHSIPDELVTSAADPATLMFTSGTTGMPKSCILPHSGFLALVPFVHHVYSVGISDLLFATSDPSWSYGLYTSGCAPMSLGLPRIIYSGDFDAHSWLKVIDEEAVTYAVGAPTAFRRVLDAALRFGWPTTLKGASTAGEPLDHETVETWTRESGTDIRDGYGLTEVGMVLGNLGNPPLPVEPGWLAATVPGFEVEVRDSCGEPVDIGSEGVLAIRRPRFQLATTYENFPTVWDARWQEDWYVTDDLFVQDEQGRFQFRGRVDDVIVSAGYNIGPVEVEAVLLEHPSVAEAAVVAAPDPDRGSVVRAVIVRTADAPDAPTLTTALKQAVRDKIGRHAHPRIVDYVDQLPRTATGKIRRAELRGSQSGSVMHTKEKQY